MTSEGKLSVKQRLELIRAVNSLPDPQFKELVFALDPPSGVMPADSAPLGNRVPVLLHWVEKSPTGPGLGKLQEVLDRVLWREEEQTDSPPDASFTEDLGNGVTLEMIHIPEGRFWMGSPESEEGRDDSEVPRHRVSVPSFFMGKYPVTQRQWHSVSLMDAVDRELRPAPSEFKGGSRPVECVSWYEAVEFCARLSKHTGKDYRLPREAEWEYACRAGTTTPFHFGEMFQPFYFGEVFSEGSANCDGYYDGTTAVGKFRANAFGLYDMHGNVWEWCEDWWHENYEGAPSDGSAWGTGCDDVPRLTRGGSWDFNPWFCRSAHRFWCNPGLGNLTIGFRVCCPAPRTP